MANTWLNELKNHLIKESGTKKGSFLFDKYESSFPHSYKDEYNASNAIADIKQMELLSSSHPLEIDLYLSLDDQTHPLHLRLCQLNEPIPLSDILPMLENMGLKTYNTRSYKIELKNDFVWISDFSVTYRQGETLDVIPVKELFEETFVKTRFGLNENDGFNALTLAAQLSWREITIIRAYAKYMIQTSFRFSQLYVEKAVTAQAAVTKNLIRLFNTMQNPTSKLREQTTDKINQQIQQSLEQITSIDEDRILRRLWDVIKATLRTNFFQTYQDQPKEYLSFKLNSSEIPELPLPRPLYEIFVYSPRFEAIHLRAAKVARGGIRWSDRKEDFRTEVLGLMKAQTVKNAVIVPSGAKGGFVLKMVPLNATRDILKQEVTACYTAFICGLLDITDNIIDEKIVPPYNVVCYDEPDPYLVVAADKGTASFSDIANAIAKQYNFWLKDAFASGGSAGYDHKKMGITARGAWESIKRHFRELNINCDTETFTAIGIGDMSGDVFGNGLTYTKNIKLLAAFDHRDIFIDPDPNPEISYNERLRLFNLPTSSWQDYDAKLISKGGGVFKRSSKSITITPEIKRVLDIQDNTLAPNDLIMAILRAPVDLLYNGGIGTYVKASTENHTDVGDKTNEYCRINGSELRCKIVGEGGNLGITQLGRVEYALQGGLIYTDFIDNSAGVDCSDHEVNIKVLLNKEITKNKLTLKARNTLLSKMTKDVANLVLKDNYNQALVLSFSATNSLKYTKLYEDFVNHLEVAGGLKRKVEYLPDEKTITARLAVGQGFSRPELAVILAYGKIHIKAEILKSTIPEDSYFDPIIQTAFPRALWEDYHSSLEKHRLRREIIATQLSNQIINSMGITFAYRMHIETGASIAEIARAHAVASEVYRTNTFVKLIESFDFKIPVKVQYDLLHHIRRLVNLATRWFLRHNRLTGDISKIVSHYATGVTKLQGLVPILMTGATKTYLDSIINRFINAGLKKRDAESIAILRAMYTALNIIEVATDNKFDLVKTAHVYFDVGNKFNLVWFRDQIANDNREGHWNTLARLSLRDELDSLQRKLTIEIMLRNKKETNTGKLIDEWRNTHSVAIDRWEGLTHVVYANENLDYLMFFIILRELEDLLQSSNKQTTAIK